MPTFGGPCRRDGSGGGNGLCTADESAPNTLPDAPGGPPRHNFSASVLPSPAFGSGGGAFPVTPSSAASNFTATTAFGPGQPWRTGAVGGLDAGGVFGVGGVGMGATSASGYDDGAFRPGGVQQPWAHGGPFGGQLLQQFGAFNAFGGGGGGGGGGHGGWHGVGGGVNAGLSTGAPYNFGALQPLRGIGGGGGSTASGTPFYPLADMHMQHAYASLARHMAAAAAAAVVSTGGRDQPAGDPRENGGVSTAADAPSLASAAPLPPGSSKLSTSVYSCKYCDYTSRASASILVHERRVRDPRLVWCVF